MKQAYYLTYKCGKHTGKLIEPIASSITEAINIVKGYYGHIQKTGVIVKQTETEAIIEASAPGIEKKLIYTLQEKKPQKRSIYS